MGSSYHYLWTREYGVVPQKYLKYANISVPLVRFRLHLAPILICMASWWAWNSAAINALIALIKWPLKTLFLVSMA